MFFTRDKSFYSSLVKLAIPIALQNAITFGVGLADNLMIGTLGDSAISGVYVGNQMQTLLQMFIGGIEGAILILAAQYWGKRDTVSIRKIVAIGIRFALAIGVLLSLVTVLFPSQILSIFTPDAAVIAEGTMYQLIVGISYIFFSISQVLVASMRAVETAKIGLYVSVAALGANVVLNYVLIFGIPGLIPPMGVVGAAVATLISRVIEMAIMIVYVGFIDKKLVFRISDLFKSDRLLTKDFIKYGLPIMGGQIVWSCNMLAQTAILGRFEAEVITATSIAGMMHNMMYILMTGLSNAVGIITGKTVGAGRIDKIREYARTTQVLFLSLGVLSGISVFLLRDPFVSLYGASPAAIEYSRQFINVMAVTIVGTCYQAACLFGLVKSGGDIGFVFKMDTIFVFLVVLPSAIIASFMGAPAWVVFACLKCDQIIKCFVAVVKINKFNWMKNLTRESTESAEA